MLVKLTQNKKIDPMITYQQLYNDTHIEFITTSCCINSKSICYCSYKTEPNLPVLTGVRMSFSFPIYITPLCYTNTLYIDGGCIDNYPIHLFKDRLHEVIGVYLNEQITIVERLNGIEDYLIHLVLCLLEGMNINSVKGYEKQTIQINIPIVNCMDFDINNKKKRKFIRIGYYATIRYLSKNKLI